MRCGGDLLNLKRQAGAGADRPAIRLDHRTSVLTHATALERAHLDKLAALAYRPLSRQYLPCIAAGGAGRMF